jgi:hypothetical protein
MKRKAVSTAVCLVAALAIGNLRYPTPANAATMPVQAKDSDAVWKKAGADEGLRQAFERVAYRLEDSGPGRYEGMNPAQRLALEFNSEEARLQHPQGDVSLRLTGYGYGQRLRTPQKSKPAASGNRVEYRRGELSEWYVNDSRGLEQGFTLARRPGVSRDGEPLAIALDVASDLRPELAAGGDAVLLRSSKGSVLRYEGLRAWDARGRVLASRLQVSGREVRLVVEDRGAEYPVTVDPVWTQQAELTASDEVGVFQFGYSVSVSGDTAVVGAVSQAASNGGQGGAYVFVRSGGVWTQQAELATPNGAQNFGYSVSVSGDTAVVGAPVTNNSQGAAYVFVRHGATWSQQAELLGADSASGDSFGISVSVSGDTALVGAPGKFNSVGTAYVFVRNGDAWTEEAELLASDGSSPSSLGFSVSISGDTAVAGAPSKRIGPNNYQGAAYVFVRSVGNVDTWTEEAELLASDGAADDEFGRSVSVSGGTAVVGASNKTVYQPSDGAAYVFARGDGAWSQQQELTGSNEPVDGGFGISVSVSGNTAVVTATSVFGDAYVFARSGGVWIQEQDLTGNPNENFGLSVSLDGNTVLVGANHAQVDVGAAYVFIAGVTFSPGSLDLGAVAVGETSAPKTVTLTNNQSVSLNFSSIVTSAGFTVASNTCGASVAAGATCTVGVTFSPTATGAATGTLTFNDDAAISPQVVTLTARGVTPVVLSPGTLDLGTVVVNQTSAAKTVTLTNHQNVSLNFSGILTSADFTVASNTCGASIAAGTTCTVGVTFSPTATGAATGTLTFTDDAANSPQAVNLTGKGVLPVSLAPGSLDLGTVAVGDTTAAKTVTLTNNQAVSLNFSSILTSANFTIASNTCGANIAAGTTCTVGVTFSPTATGAATGSLTFTDDAANSPQSISLTGTGSTPVTLAPGSLDLGTVAVGDTSDAKTVTLTNHENVPLNFSSIVASAGFAVASNTCGASIAAGTTCTVGVTFSPIATGAASGTLTFTDDAANSPQTVNLTGTGSTPVTLAPGSLNLGTVAVGDTSNAKTVTLTNHENVPLNFSSIVASAGFAVASNTCGASIAAGTTCTVGVTFSPTATGAAAGALTFTDDAANNPQAVNLTGTGR